MQVVRQESVAAARHGPALISRGPSRVQRRRTMTRKSFLARSAALGAPGLLFAGTQRGAPSISGDAHSVFDVVNHGAKGDGITKDTRAIQRALDAAGNARGTSTCLLADTFVARCI